jgi:integrase
MQLGLSVVSLGPMAHPWATLHRLRDTHASLCAQAGVPIDVVSQRLGHASIGVTASRHLHVYLDRDAEEASAFDSLIV